MPGVMKLTRFGDYIRSEITACRQQYAQWGDLALEMFGLLLLANAVPAAMLYFSAA